MVYIGFDSKGKVQLKYHVRSKGVSESYIKKLSKSDLMKHYENMLNGRSINYKSISNFKRCWKNQENHVGIKTISQDKLINQELWSGRNYDPITCRWYPIYEQKTETKFKHNKKTFDMEKIIKSNVKYIEDNNDLVKKMMNDFMN